MALNNEEKRAWAKVLLVKCPFGLELFNCPVKKIRKLPLKERMDLINNMPNKEIDTIIGHHIDCQKTRLKNNASKEQKGGRITRPKIDNK